MIPFSTLDISNGGGMAKTLADVKALCESAVTRIIVGSITWLMRPGNEAVAPGDVYFFDEDTYESGNALGLPNLGHEAYRTLLPKMVEMAHLHGKKLIASIVGESVQEIVDLVLFCFRCGVDGVEINFACPNVHDKGMQKPMFCDSPEIVEEVLFKLRAQQLQGRLIAMKVAPTLSTGLVIDLCAAVKRTEIVQEVTAGNTKGGQRFIRKGVDMIAFLPPGSSEVKYVGGQAGKPLHALALSTARMYAEHLPGGVKLNGAGGVFTGTDAYDFINLGASGIQCATAVMKFGPSIFSSIGNELLDLMPAG